MRSCLVDDGLNEQTEVSFKVLIIQEHLPHYRVPFFNRLRERLNQDGISLDLIFGEKRAAQYLEGHIDWATGVRILAFGPLRWHCRTLKAAIAADLVIAPQEMKYPVPLMIQLASGLFRGKFAYWGHGRNFQAPDVDSLAERIKRSLAVRADWWFAYNELSMRIVANLGYPAERITCVGNAIDTSSLMARREEVGDAELEVLRAELGLRSENVAIYTGGLYPTKRLDFLISAAVRIRQSIQDFELIVIGDGPERERVKAAAKMYPWIHEIGPKNDYDKVPYWALSKMLLMPGGVGLVILDSFALGVPMVTTDTLLHGPEIDYLCHGENGLLIPCGESVEPYAMAVIELFHSPRKLALLVAGARKAEGSHGMEAMVSNFAAGVSEALRTPRLR